MRAAERLLIETMAASRLTLADVGAAGGIHSRWERFKTVLCVLGFEPDARAYQSLKNTADRIWIEAGVAEEIGVRTLNITRHQTSTSLLLPNPTITEDIFAEPAGFNVVKQVPIPCTTLDRAAEEHAIEIDALKIDTQGTELNVLRGAEKSLSRSVVLVEVEVEFVPLYQGQPLFCDVNAFLLAREFSLLDVGNALYHKWRSTRHLPGIKGQLISADALYVLSPAALSRRLQNANEPIPMLAKACAVVLAYGYAELASRYLDSAPPSEAVQTFVQMLRGALERYRTPRWRKTRGLGRLSASLRSVADWISPDAHACWLNPLGNRAGFRHD